MGPCQQVTASLQAVPRQGNQIPRKTQEIRHKVTLGGGGDLTGSSQPAIRGLQDVTEWTGLVACMREKLPKSWSAKLGVSFKVRFG